MPNKKQIGVYQLSDNESGKFYIGATSNIEKRIKEHDGDLSRKKHRNSGLQELVNVVLSNNNKLSLAFFPTETTEHAFLLEKELIKNNKHDPNCLNIRGTYEPAMLNRKMSDKQKKEKSEHMKKLYAEGKLVSPMKGKTHSDTTKEKMRISKQELYANGHINHFTGKTHTNEVKEKQSQLAKSQWADPEFARKRREEGLLRVQDEEFRKRHKEATIKALESDDVRKKMSNAVKERCLDEEYRKKLSERAKERMKNPAAREASRQGAKKQWEQPGYRERMGYSVINKEKNTE